MRILLIGERCLDVFVSGPCPRISPESPVVVHVPRRTESNPGMAANVEANLHSLDPSVQIDFFHQEQLIVKTRHVDEVSGQQLIRIDTGDDAYAPDFANKVLSGMSGDYDALVISDYGKGLLSTSFMCAMTTIFNEMNKPVFADTKALLGQWSLGIDYVKINTKEFNAQLAAGVTEPWKYCRNLIVTKGRDGSVLYDNQGNVKYQAEGIPAKIAGLSGAGDTFLAALVTKYLVNGGNICGAMDYANRAAAIAVASPGVVAVSYKDVDN